MNVKMSKGSWVAVLVILTIAFMASLWMVDVSVSAMRVSTDSLGEAVLTNGFWVRSPAEAYHIGLWMPWLPISPRLWLLLKC